MNKTRDLISNSLKFYDSNNEKNYKIFNKFKFYSIIFTKSDIDHNIINFYDIDKNKIFQSRYEVLGVYNSSINSWIWSWAIPVLSKNMVYTSRKILNYGLDLVPSKDDLFIKSELITSRFKITSDIQLDIHASIASYIAKRAMIYKLIIIPSLLTLESSTSDIYELLNNPTDDYVIYYLFLLDESGVVKSK